MSKERKRKGKKRENKNERQKKLRERMGFALVVECLPVFLCEDEVI